MDGPTYEEVIFVCLIFQIFIFLIYECDIWDAADIFFTTI